MKLMIGVVLGALLTGCALLSAPESENPVSTPTPQTQQHPAGPPGASPAQSAPRAGAPVPTPPEEQVPQQRAFTLGAAATSLVGAAHAQEQSRDFGLAAQTLERALSIEPRNPLVWLELGRENIMAGNPTQAYGMGRKALYLASGDPHAQARAWELIAASLRAQGRNDEAYVAEEKAVAVAPQ
jgi:tetratricopeptide (TPR) repeat protein